MLKIWGRTTSLNVQKVLWLCTELGLAFERVDWGGPFGGNDDPAYRALNPNGLVPTLQDGDAVIWESNTILRYLCASYGGAVLHPVAPLRRSDVERWMDWQLSRLNPSMTVLLLGYYRMPPEKRDAAALEAARQQAIGQWRIIETWLDHRDYLVGDGLTLADIGNGILAYRWFNYPIERPELPRVAGWLDRLDRRAGFQAHVAGPIA